MIRPLQRGLATLVLTCGLAVLPGAISAAAQAAVAGVNAVVSADCPRSRLTLTLHNDSSSTQTFTVTWPGRSGSPWTRVVSPGNSALLYWTIATGTPYTLHTTTTSGHDSTQSGRLHCGTGMSAIASMDCSRSRLQLVLENRTSSAKTFVVTWPARWDSPWTRTVAAGANFLHYWTVPAGTPYSLRTTSDNFDTTSTGVATCGLDVATPQMNATTILSTSTVINGLNGDNGPYNGTAASVRIPGMGVTNNGTIIAVADARVDGSYDLGGGTNDIQIAMMRSTDNGETWEQPRIIHHEDNTSEGVGDPSILVDRTTGVVYCFYTYSPRPGVSFWSGASGSNSADDPNSLHLQYIRSTDNGVTWSAPVELNPSIKHTSWQSLFFSSGHGIQSSTGRLIQPFVYRDSSGVSHAANVYSDDHGATWHRGGSAGPNINESKAIERGNGGIVQNMRHNSVAARYYSTSTNGGVTFGSATNSGLIDPRCNADELSYVRPDQQGGNGAPIRTSTALFSNNYSTGSRVNLTVQLSTNDGSGWQARALLKPGAAGYSTMAVLGNGDIGNLYEIGNTGGIVFSRFTMDWLRAA